MLNSLNSKLRSFAVWAMGMLLFTSCSSTPDYTYQYRPGHSAVLVNGSYASAPATAPAAVHEAIAAANRIVGTPYRMGGGHGTGWDTAYDCSGAVSHVLTAAGLLEGSMPSSAFRRYGSSGAGEWFSVYARKGHVFLVVADLRFDTGWGGGGKGPQWTTRSRPAGDFTLRHPTGL